MNMEAISTPRLTLLPTPAAAMNLRLDSPAAFDLGGVHYPAAWPGDALALFPFALALPPAERPWDFVVVRQGVAIGQMGFKTLPQGGAAEVGYGLNPEARGQGYASEALRALCGWAFARGLEVVQAETLPANAASIGVLQKCGFEQVDERQGFTEGRLLCWELRRSTAP